MGSALAGLRQPDPPGLVQANALRRFVDALPRPPRWDADPHGPSSYRVEMSQIEAQVHRDLPPTRQWAYNASVPGPTIHVRSGQALSIQWVNRLPTTHFLPVDTTLHGAQPPVPQVRTVAHVHGAKVPADSDGYPERWIVPGQSVTHRYPNRQDAASLWYHDHAMGITRLNILAGLVGAYLIGDAVEDALGLPQDDCDWPLVLYDRTFTHDGQLHYPVSQDPRAPWLPEFFGNTILCNGKLYPYLEVQARPYRFRIINAANARFFGLSLSHRMALHQIGTDVGLLPAAVTLARLELFPGERADVIIDFGAMGGEEIHLLHEHEAILQFRVARREPALAQAWPKQLRPLRRIAEGEAVKTRVLTLGEQDDAAGNAHLMLLNGLRWDQPVSEKPVLGSTEIWSLVNLTGDAHPIHLHLVRFQILDRRPFDVFAHNAGHGIRYTGEAVAAADNECGWKDTVRADPGMVTRIIVRFEGHCGRYVWHCHLLEHEDKEMMRPYEVVAPSKGQPTRPLPP